MSSNAYDPEKWKVCQLCVSRQSEFPTSISSTISILECNACTFPEIDLRSYPFIETFIVRSFLIPLRIYFPSNLKTFIIQNTHNVEFMSDFPTTLKTIMITNSNIHLPSLSNVHALEHLHMNVSRITELPNLPPNLKELYCSDLKITSLHEFPANIEIISIYNCSQLHTLPSSFPSGLRKLKIASTQIEDVPVLPPNITHLDLYDSCLKKLGSLPKRLVQLDVHKNDLESLPDLPATLEFLNIRDNPIEYYPYIPNKRCIVYIDYNQLSAAFNYQSFILNGRKVFSPLHLVRDLVDDDRDVYMSDIFDDDDTNDTHKRLEVMYEIQKQYLCHMFLRTSKEELIMRTWHPSRIEDWCGVNFTADDD